jgi:hypothetical protein
VEGLTPGPGHSAQGKGRAEERYKKDEIEKMRLKRGPEPSMIAHDKRPGNPNGLQKGPRPREILAKGRA